MYNNCFYPEINKPSHVIQEFTFLPR